VKNAPLVDRRTGEAWWPAVKRTDICGYFRPVSDKRVMGGCGGLYELILNGQLTHDGDEVFATQVLNAVPRFNEHGFVLTKSKSRGKIDAAIALALAYDRVQLSEVDPEFSAGVAFG
jgi:phage terminase large subunit-like protein